MFGELSIHVKNPFVMLFVCVWPLTLDVENNIFDDSIGSNTQSLS